MFIDAEEYPNSTREIEFFQRIMDKTINEENSWNKYSYFSNIRFDFIELYFRRIFRLKKPLNKINALSKFTCDSNFVIGAT